MTEYTLDTLEGLAFGLRFADRAERYLDRSLAVHLWGYEEIVKDTPLQVGVFWNRDRSDMVLAGQIPDFSFDLESTKQLVPKKAHANVFWKAETGQASATLWANSQSFSGVGRSPALALCAACVAYEQERRRAWLLAAA